LLQIYYNVFVLCFRMRSSQVVIASNSQCRSLNCLGSISASSDTADHEGGFSFILFWHFTRNQTGNYRYLPKITFYLFSKCLKMYSFFLQILRNFVVTHFFVGSAFNFFWEHFKSWHQQIWNQHNIFVFWYPYWYFSRKPFLGS
jgi:hypothetical protein